MNSSPHFKGKKPLEHVIEARLKGMAATEEAHGAELPGHYSAGADGAKETALLLLILWTLLSELQFPSTQIHWISISLIIGWIFWKVSRSAILGYARLERLHRLIEEERWEIEHHRPQEKEELKALYAAKGFSGELLDEVVEILMADDNRLLQIMLEEELGLKIESYEHPLKQALGAFFGTFGTVLAMACGFFFLPWWGAPAVAGGVICAASAFTARLERNSTTHAVLWNLSCATLAACVSFFAVQIFLRGS